MKVVRWVGGSRNDKGGTFELDKNLGKMKPRMDYGRSEVSFILWLESTQERGQPESGFGFLNTALVPRDKSNSFRLHPPSFSAKHPTECISVTTGWL